ncbi:MAG TPA: dipeptide epimerase [Polyangiaceae bacterium]|nr:dipeptide epimerase [Polyangiaceae bacterium]
MDGWFGEERGEGDHLRIEEVRVRALSVPLREPFVIASGRVDATRAAEVSVRVAWRGRTATGLGEAACLPPVTREDQGDVLREVARLAPALAERPLVATARALEDALREAFPAAPVARAGVETAVLDAMARCAGVPLRTLLGGARGAAASALETDVTVAIAAPEIMARLAREWCERGFRALKIKVGKDVDADARTLAAIAAAAPGARLRVDANAGYTAREAIALGRACADLDVECWEQPCAADDFDGLAEVAAALDAPVVADESMRDAASLRALAGRVDGVNLKLAKHGGPLHALRLGLEAQAAGLRLMMGGMVETRLGMTAAAHVACALGGVDFADLDTAWLLAADPYCGGYEARGPLYTMPLSPGLGVSVRT